MNILNQIVLKAHAQDLESIYSQYDPTPDTTSLIDSLLNRIPVYLGALAILALLIAGIQYAFAYGDAAKQEQAKKNITWTVIGIIAASSITLLIKLAIWFVKPGIS